MAAPPPSSSSAIGPEVGQAPSVNSEADLGEDSAAPEATLLGNFLGGLRSAAGAMIAGWPADPAPAPAPTVEPEPEFGGEVEPSPAPLVPVPPASPIPPHADLRDVGSLPAPPLAAAVVHPAAHIQQEAAPSPSAAGSSPPRHLGLFFGPGGDDMSWGAPPPTGDTSPAAHIGVLDTCHWTPVQEATSPPRPASPAGSDPPMFLLMPEEPAPAASLP